MKSKFSLRTQALIKANKILKKHYTSILKGRDLTEQEIIGEANMVLRHAEDGTIYDNFKFYYQMDKSEWELIAKKN
jgi:hypothetical protein